MLYLIAILFPPLAVLACGKPFQSLLNVPLTFAFWLPGMAHALLVVHNYYADQRTARIVGALRHQDAVATLGGFCPQCGASTTREEGFCVGCGSPVVDLGLEPDPPTLMGRVAEGGIPRLLRHRRNHKRLRQYGR